MALLYPQITRIRDVSISVARYVIRSAQKENVDRLHHLRDISDHELDEWILSKMYNPHMETTVLEEEVDALVNELKRPSQTKI